MAGINEMTAPFTTLIFQMFVKSIVLESKITGIKIDSKVDIHSEDNIKECCCKNSERGLFAVRRQENLFIYNQGCGTVVEMFDSDFPRELNYDFNFPKNLILALTFQRV